MTIEQLPAVNASLNAVAVVLLVTGYVFIRQRRETAHKVMMMMAFGVSVVFLICYLVYHYWAGHVKFSGPAPISYVYYTMLASHVILAMAVPFLAIGSILLGWLDRRSAHRRLSRWTLPIWLYVSVTGVAVYLMLYHLYPPLNETNIIR